MKSYSSLPIAAEPNAGLPELVGGKVRFNLPPEDFAEGASKIVNNGALVQALKH
jgi:5-methyltetrahydrofolate--homocysteine methyltransferase